MSSLPRFFRPKKISHTDGTETTVRTVSRVGNQTTTGVVQSPNQESTLERGVASIRERVLSDIMQHSSEPMELDRAKKLPSSVVPSQLVGWRRPA